MRDVHPPHEVTRSWKDYFIRIANICVRFIMAVGPEQMAEATPL